MVLKSFINILCSSDSHLTNSNYFRDRIRVMLKMAAVNGMAMESQVTRMGHLWPAAPTGLRCREKPGKGRCKGGVTRGRALCKCISICVHIHVDVLREAHKGLTPWRVNSCKTRFVLGIESAQHLAGLDTDAALLRTYVTSERGVKNCAQCLTTKYT